MAVRGQTGSPILEQADRLLAPLVQEGIFNNYFELLRALLLDYIERQIASYRERVSSFERKYGLSFEKYSKRLQGQASLEDEDEWMDWEETLIFLRKWESVKKQVLHVTL
ncbi:MAG: hypothetical protein ACE5JI_22255 [Acidobacteriota bacterium]